MHRTLSFEDLLVNQFVFVRTLELATGELEHLSSFMILKQMSFMSVVLIPRHRPRVALYTKAVKESVQKCTDDFPEIVAADTDISRDDDVVYTYNHLKNITKTSSSQRSIPQT